MFPSLPPVVLNTQVVHLHTYNHLFLNPYGCLHPCCLYQRGAAVVDEEIEKADEEGSEEGHQDDACSLQQEAQQIELHGHEVPVPPLGLGCFGQTGHLVILVFYKPKRRKMKNARQSTMCLG